jgi:hypothetical protein
MLEIKKDKAKEQCLSCKSQEVCKYKEDYMKLYGSISNLLSDDIFTASLTCKYYSYFSIDMPVFRQTGETHPPFPQNARQPGPEGSFEIRRKANENHIV